MKILSLITHPHVVPNTQDLRSSSELKLRYFCLNLRALRPSHRQQGSLHDQGPEKYQDDRQSSPCDISLSTVILRRHQNTFCAKKTKITILFHIFISTVSLVDVRSRQYMTQVRGSASADPDHRGDRSSWYFSGPWSCKDPCCLWEGLRALRFKQKYLNLCSEDERRSYGFGTTRGWVINDRIFIFGWTIPLRIRVKFQCL